MKETVIELIPRCKNCNFELEGIEIFKNFIKKDIFTYGETSLVPEICPNCGFKFISIDISKEKGLY